MRGFVPHFNIQNTMERIIFEGSPQRIEELKKYISTYIKMKKIVIVTETETENDFNEFETKETKKRNK